MTVSLGGIALSDHLVLDGIEAAADVATSARQTLGGRTIVQTASIIGGRVLFLSAEHHFTLGQIKAIKAMAALGQPVELIHHRERLNVVITGTPVEPSINYADPGDDAWYSGTITMIEV